MLTIGQISHLLINLKRQTINTIKELFLFNFFKLYFTIFVIVNTSSWLLSYYINKTLNEPKIALHYNVDFGVDYYGSSGNIFILPLLGFIIFVFNAMLFSIVRNQKDRKFIGQILCSVAILANLILLVGVISIYLINTKY